MLNVSGDPAAVAATSILVYPEPRNTKQLISQRESPQRFYQLAIIMDVPDEMQDFVTAMQQVYQFPMTVDDK
ncbi:unnamed protein product [Aureobasidium vineae]|uniref:Uncharacterized protein n=1 Tax=Aureobasidium vineae TaxID=2773715 RepID=A0A9N8JS76_9PEZI|nr:unnamed protein product [Aureobasidium vineae]